MLQSNWLTPFLPNMSEKQTNRLPLAKNMMEKKNWKKPKNGLHHYGQIPAEYQDKTTNF